MFSLQVVPPGPDSPYSTPVYWLRDESAQSAIAVLPDRGAIVMQWQVQGKDYFYMDWDRYQDPKNTIRGGNPVLFPICGNLLNNQYTIEGQSYDLKQHGFAREMPWAVTATSTEGEAALTLTLTATPDTLAHYPFAFQVSITYRLSGHTLTIDQNYCNTGDGVMPFSAGFHPYFKVNDKSQLRFDLPSTESWDQPAQVRAPFFNTFDFESNEIDWAFGDLTRSVAIVSDLEQQTRLTISYGPEFSTLVFWTLKGKDFYCLEPWSAGRNAINTGENMLFLQPGEARSLSVTYKVEQL